MFPPYLKIWMLQASVQDAQRQQSAAGAVATWPVEFGISQSCCQKSRSLSSTLPRPLLTLPSHYQQGSSDHVAELCLILLISKLAKEKRSQFPSWNSHDSSQLGKHGGQREVEFPLSVAAHVGSIRVTQGPAREFLQSLTKFDWLQKKTNLIHEQPSLGFCQCHPTSLMGIMLVQLEQERFQPKYSSVCQWEYSGSIPGPIFIHFPTMPLCFFFFLKYKSHLSLVNFCPCSPSVARLQGTNPSGKYSTHLVLTETVFQRILMG